MNEFVLANLALLSIIGFILLLNWAIKECIKYDGDPGPLCVVAMSLLILFWAPFYWIGYINENWRLEEERIVQIQNLITYDGNVHQILINPWEWGYLNVNKKYGKVYKPGAAFIVRKMSKGPYNGIYSSHTHYEYEEVTDGKILRDSTTLESDNRGGKPEGSGDKST